MGLKDRFKKTEDITIRMTKLEMEWLIRDSEKCKLNASEYLRRLIVLGHKGVNKYIKDKSE